MHQKTALDLFSVKDHQKILAIIDWLNSCQTRADFNQALQIALLPLISCGGIFYTRYVNEKNGQQLLDSVMQPSSRQNDWQRFLTDSTVNHTASNDISISQHYLPDQLSEPSKPQYTILKLQDNEKPSFRFYFWCLNKDHPLFTQRELALLEILRPILLQTIKLIILHEEKPSTCQANRFWSEYIEPLAVINTNGDTLFQNHTFQKIAGYEKNLFPSMLRTHIKVIEHNHLDWHCFLTKLSRRLYAIKLTLINADINFYQYAYFLLHLSRITNKAGKIHNQFKRKELTERELEIAMLIYQGMQTREISEKIHISYHTVRNHIKNIYYKLGVSSRCEMLVWMG